ncbi:MAG: hypothetical protein ACRD1R_07220 [Acidobacteriota bacterium]
MHKYLLFLLFSFPLFNYGMAATLFYFPQIGDGVQNGVRLQTNLVFTGLESAAVTVEFFDSEGQRLQMAFADDRPAGSVIELSLGRGEVVLVQTAGTESLKSGYARVTADAQIGANAIFTGTEIETERVLFEAGVPATTTESEFTIFLDSIGSHDTGLAFVHASQVGQEQVDGEEEPPVQITIKIYDTNFTLIATAQMELASGHHLAQFIWQFLEDSEVISRVRDMLGLVTITSDRPLAPVTLRQDEETLLLTTFPVVSGSPEAGESTNFFFSFEESMQGWYPTGTDLEHAGGTLEWSIEPTEEMATHGSRSLQFFLENLNDAGKIWVQRNFSLEPETTYEVQVEYDFGTGDGDINAFMIITGASPGPPETWDDLDFQESTSNGTGEPGFAWLDKSYTFTVESSPEGLIYVAIGVWGTYEVSRTYLVDAVNITFTERRKGDTHVIASESRVNSARSLQSGTNQSIAASIGNVLLVHRICLTTFRTPDIPPKTSGNSRHLRTGGIRAVTAFGPSSNFERENFGQKAEKADLIPAGQPKASPFSSSEPP